MFGLSFFAMGGCSKVVKGTGDVLRGIANGHIRLDTNAGRLWCESQC
jgi:hypothetical protein